MNAIVPATGAVALVPHDMQGAMRLAEMMATGKLVPSHLQRSPGDCLMVVEQAMRWGMSPFAVAQCTSVIQGKLMFEGKLVAAALHSSGILSGRLDYEFTGQDATRAIIARATLRGETKPREVTVTLKEAKTSNGMWTKQPDQQLVYSATRVWARRHAPEVMLGVYSPEEMDPAPADTFTGTTIEAHSEPLRRPTTAEAIGDDIPDALKGGAPKRRTIAEWLTDLESALAVSDTADAVDVIVSSPEVQKALDTLRNGARERLTAIIKVAQDRTAPTVDDGGAAHEPALVDDEVPF